ncbi:hypothetical protein diail_3321 [Diaporthe ilicicola]|nr:hypothetical protein diail_3321 [Diaporthe ilicicola]
MKSINNLILLGLGLVGSAVAISYCCRPGCAVCIMEECGSLHPCLNFWFNTCCADERLADKTPSMVFDNDEDYLAAVAAGRIDG